MPVRVFQALAAITPVDNNQIEESIDAIRRMGVVVPCEEPVIHILELSLAQDRDYFVVPGLAILNRDHSLRLPGKPDRRPARAELEHQGILVENSG